MRDEPSIDVWLEPPCLTRQVSTRRPLAGSWLLAGESLDLAFAEDGLRDFGFWAERQVETMA